MFVLHASFVEFQLYFNKLIHYKISYFSLTVLSIGEERMFLINIAVLDKYG